MSSSVLRSLTMVAVIVASLATVSGPAQAADVSDLSFDGEVSIYDWDTVSEDLFSLESMTLEDGTTVFFEPDSRSPSALIMNTSAPADATFGEVLLAAIDAAKDILAANPNLKITLKVSWGDVEVEFVMEATI